MLPCGCRNASCQIQRGKRYRCATCTTTIAFGAECMTQPRQQCWRFGAEFDRLRDIPELNGKIRKFGNRYYGIALMRDGPLVPSHRGAAGFERT